VLVMRLARAWRVEMHDVCQGTPAFVAERRNPVASGICSPEATQQAMYRLANCFVLRAHMAHVRRHWMRTAFLKSSLGMDRKFQS
jgi:hypothetical protein